MYDETELRGMSEDERARLARALATLDAPRPLSDPGIQRRRRFLIAAAVVCALVLAAWIGVLAVTLPRHFRAGGWRAAWVGFDIGLLAVFLATAWSAWRRRQMLILCLIVLATLLCCDAWFDTTLDWGTSGFTLSLLSALLVELPLAAVALVGAWRLLRLTIGRLEALEGEPGPVPPFWRVPLFGDESITYHDLLPPARRDVSEEVASVQAAGEPQGDAGASRQLLPGLTPAGPAAARVGEALSSAASAPASPGCWN